MIITIMYLHDIAKRCLYNSAQIWLYEYEYKVLEYISNYKSSILGKVSPLVYFLFADTKYRQHRQDLYVRVNIDWFRSQRVMQRFLDKPKTKVCILVVKRCSIFYKK